MFVSENIYVLRNVLFVWLIVNMIILMMASIQQIIMETKIKMFIFQMETRLNMYIKIKSFISKLENH